MPGEDGEPPAPGAVVGIFKGASLERLLGGAVDVVGAGVDRRAQHRQAQGLKRSHRREDHASAFERETKGVGGCGVGLAHLDDVGEGLLEGGEFV